MEINSLVTKSPRFAVIMDSHDKFGSKLSVRAFWLQYVVPEDPKITYQMWARYAKKITGSKKVFAVTLPAPSPPAVPPPAIPDKKPIDFPNTIDPMPGQVLAPIEGGESNATMEESSLRNIFAISEHTLDELVEHPELLVAIPVKERMKWLFQAMKARDSRMVALTRVQSEKRKTSLYEDMIQGAQYGEIEEDEFSEPPKAAPDRPETPASDSPSPAPANQKTEEKTIKFDPKNL